MATGQTLLALASIVLLSIITMSIRSMYVQSVETTVESQEMQDAINFGRDISEELQSFAFGFSDMGAIQSRMNSLSGQFQSSNTVLNEKTSSANSLWIVKREEESQIGRQYYASIEMPTSMQTLTSHNQQGVIATIRIFEEIEDNEFEKIAEYRTAVLPL
jgi:hypothetical protein